MWESQIFCSTVCFDLAINLQSLMLLQNCQVTIFLAINLQSLMLLQNCQVTVFLAITKIATFGILQS